MDILYVIRVTVDSKQNTLPFETTSHTFEAYPHTDDIKDEIERLQGKGFRVHYARVEKRYRLSQGV